MCTCICCVLIAGSTIKVGDKVRVKPSIAMPTYKWGSVTHRSIGTVTGISPLLNTNI